MSKPSHDSQSSDAIKRALYAVKDMRAKLAAMEQAQKAPIAIIGIGCRLPQDITGPEAYWRLLYEGGDAVSDIPADRWDIEAFYDPDPDAPGKMYTRSGAFVRHVDQFDPAFFGLSPREAVRMDPQQRMLLEVTWEALERAGYAPDTLSGSQTGVFVGISTNDFAHVMRRVQDVTDIDPYTGTGGAFCIASGRISYCLGLQGPNFAVDTACSSSLVAVHLACQNLRAGKAHLAVAGGVNLILLPETNVYFSRMRAISPDGRCKTFDAAADGYGRGEGCGVVVLKRLRDALEDGDHVLAVIRGSAINHDGRSSGLTVPNGQAQRAVIRHALADSDVHPSQVSYLEAHGTGTPLGDPIEIRSLAAVLCEGRSKAQPLVVGSVKTNLGHLEAAAGIAGLIKVVLALQHQEIPAHLHFTQPSSHIPWEQLPVHIPTERMPWLPIDGERIAGISSFGFSGTNAHVIVSEAPQPASRASSMERPWHVLSLSAKSDKALRELAGRYEQHVSQHPHLFLGDVSFTANTGRSHFAHRLAMTARSVEEMREKLGTVVAGNRPAGVVQGQCEGTPPGKLAMLFTGQGSQYVNMGRQLYDTQPTFRATLEHCEALVRPYLPQPLLTVMYPPDEATSEIDQTAYAQPALFALEYALAELWRAWGIRPQVVLGHSVGEYVAACIAGACTLEEGLRLVAERGRLMQSLPPGGGMVAIFAEEAQVAQALEPYRETVAMATLNGSQHVVISGAQGALAAICESLETEGIKYTALAVSHAFHSPLMEPILDEFARVVESIAWQATRLPLVSNLTGEVLPAGTVLDAAYWCRHLRETVRFADSMHTLVAQGYTQFVEVGPRPTLIGLGRQCVAEVEGVWVASLRQGRDDWQQLLHSLGTLYVQGVEVEWAGVERDYARQRVVLPTYPFQRQRYWLEPDPQAHNRHAVSSRHNLTHSQGAHPLLGHRLRSPLIVDRIFETQFHANVLTMLQDHQVHGMVVFPATAYVEMVLAAAMQSFGAGQYTIEDLMIRQALILSEDEPRTVQCLLSTQAENTICKIVSMLEGPEHEEPAWTLHAEGKVRIVPEDAARPLQGGSLEEIRKRCREEVAVDQYYNSLQDRGLAYGANFRGITRLWCTAGEALSQLCLPNALRPEAGAYHLHPVLLDAAFQTLGAACQSHEALSQDTAVYLPLSLKHVRVYGQVGASLWSHASIHNDHDPSNETLQGDIRLFDESGRLVADVQGLLLKRVESSVLRHAVRQPAQEWLYRVVWQPQTIMPAASAINPVVPEEPGSWLVFADGQGVGEAVAQLLLAAGAACTVVYAGDTYSVAPDGKVQINPQRLEDFQRLVQEVQQIAVLPLRGVVYLWALDYGPTLPQVPSTQIQTAVERICGSVVHLVQAMRSLFSNLLGLWLGTCETQPVSSQDSVRGVAQAPLWGLGHTVRLEHPELRCVCVDLDASEITEAPQRLFDALWSQDPERQIAFRHQTRYVARLVPSDTASTSESPPPEPHDQPICLQVTARGVLDHLQLQPMTRRQPGPGEVEIRVRATGLNFRDVLNALGMYPGDPGPLGGECAGEVVAVGEGVEAFRVGDDVLGLAPGAFRTYVTTNAALLVAKPQQLRFEEAATIPIAFLTALYGLHHLAKMSPGERVLIHAAAGGVGMAAVQLAQRAGVEVFATASRGKWECLRSMGVRYIMDSRALDFADEIMTYTDGQGVDIVLNAFTGEFIPKSLSVLRSNGRFLEIGKRGVLSQEQVKQWRSDVSYVAYDLAELVQETPGKMQTMLRELMEAFSQGTLTPLPQQIFPLSRAVEAFRYMAQAKHIGKVVIQPHPTPAGVSPQLPPVRIVADASYLITGGLGALGLRVAQWFVAHGARSLVLMGRSGASPETQQCLDVLQGMGATIRVAQGDVCHAGDVAHVLAEIKQCLPPLKGIIHAAGVLDDGVVLQQDWQRLAKVFMPKVQGAWNVHVQTQQMDLDFFVLFSSAASVLGSPGQGNYVAANTFLDALAHYRRAQGLPALSINWGPWAEAGMAADQGSRGERRMTQYGVNFVPPEQGLQVLERLLQQTLPQVAVLPITWSTFLKPLQGGERSTLFAEVAPNVGLTDREDSSQSGTIDILQQLEHAAPSARIDCLIAYVRMQVAKVLGFPPAQLPAPHEGLTDMGMDSLTAIELKNRIEADLGVVVPLEDLFQGHSVVQIATQITQRLPATMTLIPTPGAMREAATANDWETLEL